VKIRIVMAKTPEVKKDLHLKCCQCGAEGFKDIAVSHMGVPESKALCWDCKQEIGKALMDAMIAQAPKLLASLEKIVGQADSAPAAAPTSASAADGLRGPTGEDSRESREDQSADGRTPENGE
jgi:hypothetical protein